MSVGVVIVTHYGLGEQFLQALRLIVPDPPDYRAVTIEPGQSVDDLPSATADATQIGQVGRLLARITTRETPLLRQLARFGRWLTVGIVVLAVTTFAFGRLVHDFPTIDMFLAALGLAAQAQVRRRAHPASAAGAVPRGRSQERTDHL